VNVIILSGNLLADPRYSPGRDGDESKARCNFRIAVNQGTGDNRVMNPMDVVVFGRGAGHIANSIKKGREVHVKGRLEASPIKAESLPDDAGKRYERTVWGIIADAYEGVTFGREPGGNGNGGGGQAPAQQPAEEKPPF
jgi:single-stranded DNA-binding protein